MLVRRQGDIAFLRDATKRCCFPQAEIDSVGRKVIVQKVLNGGYTREKRFHTGVAASISVLSLGSCDNVERQSLVFFGAIDERNAGWVGLDILLE